MASSSSSSSSSFCCCFSLLPPTARHLGSRNTQAHVPERRLVPGRAESGLTLYSRTDLLPSSHILENLSHSSPLLLAGWTHCPFLQIIYPNVVIY